MAALETPPSLEEIADQLYAEVYAGEDAGASRRPADRRRGLAIGYANWHEVREAVRDDGDLCGNVAALASSRAADEGQRDYDIHPSWAGRIADWIREHVAAALELIGLRRRQASRLARRKTAESIAPSLGVDPNVVYAGAGRQEDRLVALEATCYARATGFPMVKFDDITATGKRRGSGYAAVWEECVRTKAREEVRKVLPFEAPDRARPGALVVAVSGGPSRDLLQQVADDAFAHDISERGAGRISRQRRAASAGRGLLPSAPNRSRARETAAGTRVVLVDTDTGGSEAGGPGALRSGVGHAGAQGMRCARPRQPDGANGRGGSGAPRRGCAGVRLAAGETVSGEQFAGGRRFR